MLSSHCRGIGPHLAFSGVLVVFLELWQEDCFPLELRQGLQVTSHVASGKSGLLLLCEGHLGIPLKSLQGNRASSLKEGNPGVFLVLQLEILGSSLVVTGTSGNLSCCFREVCPPFTLCWESRDSFRVTAGK